MTTILTLTALMGSTAAHAESVDCDDCTFTDMVSGEYRLAQEGPSESSYEALKEDEQGGYRIREELADKYEVELQTGGKTFEDEGDEEYDEADDEDPWWIILLKAILAAADLVEDLEMNGDYDGTLTVDGQQIQAFIELDHVGSQIQGRAYVMEAFEIDGGICGTVEVPAGTGFQIQATETTAPSHLAHTAEGSTRRRVRDTIFFDIWAETTFDFSLHNDLQTLSGTIDLALTNPCADTSMWGSFTRRSIF